MKAGKPLCSLETKICSAWGDSYHQTFDGRNFVLKGNCNYTLVQTTCLGSNASIPVHIRIARAYTSSATISSIYTVLINIQGFNVSMVRGEKHKVRVSVS